MKQKITPIIENVAESTAACLITMAQGNVIGFGITHWLIASQTGVVAGAIATAAMLATQTNRRWIISAVLGVSTGVVDFFMHPGSFGPVAMEAIVTGIGAAALSYMAGPAYRFYRGRFFATA